MSEFDLSAKLRAVFPEGTVMDIDPILEMGKRRGLIHPVLCVDAVLNTMVDLRGGNSAQSFFQEWNEVNHISGCGKRACREVRPFMSALNYGIPSGQNYDNLRHVVKQCFGWDRAEDVLVSERERQLSDLLEYGEDPDFIAKLKRNIQFRGIGAAALLDIPLELFRKGKVEYRSWIRELDRRNMISTEKEALDNAISLFSIRSDKLRAVGEEWFEILATQKGI